MGESVHIMQDYENKFYRIAPRTPWRDLPRGQRAFIRDLARRHRFTLQELRQVSEIARDLEAWKQGDLVSRRPGEGRGKEALLAELREWHAALREGMKNYDGFGPGDKPPALKPRLRLTERPRLGMGRCPVASPRTRCCNLLTLDAVEGCGFDCSYCSIQSFYHGNEVKFDAGFGEKLARLRLDPGQVYHIGTGQSSDSLLWGNHSGGLEALCEFARRHPGVILELKTKSRNIAWLLKNDVPANVICTWSLNSPTVIRHEEHMTAPLEERLNAAERLAGKGVLVGFHFHPMVWHRGWEAEYGDACGELLRRFEPRQVAMVSLGTLTFTRQVMKTIRQRNFRTRILQMPLVECAGKFSYPEEIKLELFRLVLDALDDWREEVFFYLCMETAALWKRLFGRDYPSNEAFEKAMKESYMAKIAAAAAGTGGCIPAASGRGLE